MSTASPLSRSILRARRSSYRARTNRQACQALAPSRSDKEGRFRPEPLVPGARYHLVVTQPSAILNSTEQGSIAEVTVESGKHRDLDNLKPGR